MNKTIQTPSGKEVRLSNAAVFLIVYKNQFNREPLKDIIKIQKSFNLSESKDSTEALANVELEHLYNIAWALAKSADSKTGTPLDFYSKYDDFIPLDHADEILTMAIESLTGEAIVSEEADKKN